MDDAYVLLFHGGRGGGKTMSAVVQCIIDMVCFGQKVFSMVPIVFDYREDEDSPAIHYESQFFDIDSLLAQDTMFHNSVVLWDEINLWLLSRNHAAVLNKLSGQLATLLRKLDMSLYATTQFMSLVEKNIRIQADATILCFDLHYTYHNLSKGQIINQQLQDMSGKFTGRPFETTGMTYERLLHGDQFKGTYDTKKTFDIYEASRRYRIKMDIKEITRDGVVSPIEEKRILYDKVKQLADVLPGDRWASQDIMDYLKNNNIEADPRMIGRMMKAAGYKHKQTSGGGSYVYLREESPESV
jgi:hypothetical protein